MEAGSSTASDYTEDRGPGHCLRRMVDVLASGRAREPVRPGTIDWTDRGNEAPGAPWLVKSRPRNRNWGRGLGFSLARVFGIVPTCPTAHWTLCAAKRRKFGAYAGDKSWERANLEATKLSSRDPWIALRWHDALRLEQVLRADARSTPCGRSLPRRAGRPA